MGIDWEAYFKRISEGLTADARTVRDFIGSAHWGHDGAHKEAILRAYLRKFLPPGLMIGQGFVVDHADHSNRSREQDILIVDVSNGGPLFQRGEFVVSLYQDVVAAISVKTAAKSAEVKDTLAVLASAKLGASNSGCFAGFFYDDRAFSGQARSGFRQSFRTGVTEIPANALHPKAELLPDCLIWGSDCFIQWSAEGLDAYNVPGFAPLLLVRCILQELRRRTGAPPTQLELATDNLPFGQQDRLIVGSEVL